MTETDEPEASLKLTIGMLWEELDDIERQVLTKMINVEMGQLALSKVSTVIKAIVYRYHDFELRAQQAQQQAQMAQAYQQQAIQNQQVANHQHSIQGIGNGGGGGSWPGYIGGSGPGWLGPGYAGTTTMHPSTAGYVTSQATPFKSLLAKLLGP